MFLTPGRDEFKDHRFSWVHPIHVQPLSRRQVATRHLDFVIWLEQRGIEPVRHSVRNEDTMTHGLNSSLFEPNDKVQMRGAYLGPGNGLHVYRVEPGKTM